MARKPHALEWVIVVIGLVGVLALASYVTTLRKWDGGGFPVGETRIRIVDGSGTPVSGVTLEVSDLQSEDVSGSFPIYENTEPGGMTSDEDGLIVCHQVRRGVQFSGTSWELFWSIPMGDPVPYYECRFSKPGYKTVVMSARGLLAPEKQLPETAPTTTFVVDGREKQMLFWTRTVTMDRAAP